MNIFLNGNIMSNKKTALVTGAAGGLGQAIAHKLAIDGFNVVLQDINPEVHSAAAELESVSCVMPHVCDLTSEQQVTDLFEASARQFGAVDVLVNCAGITPKHNGKSLPVESTPLVEWNAVVAVNLTAPFLTSRAAIAHMKEKRWGRIVNISSQAGRTRSTISGSHYSATKAGLIGFSRMLAAELGPHGITVNTVAPGFIESGLALTVDKTVAAVYREKIPVGRFGRSDEVGALVSFIASPEAAFITGAIFDINGGMFMP